MAEYATVDQVIDILKAVSDAGMGDYVVTCNDEYYLASQDDEPGIDAVNKTVNLGGYI